MLVPPLTPHMGAKCKRILTLSIRLRLSLSARVVARSAAWKKQPVSRCHTVGPAPESCCSCANDTSEQTSIDSTSCTSYLNEFRGMAHWAQRNPSASSNTTLHLAFECRRNGDVCCLPACLFQPRRHDTAATFQCRPRMWKPASPPEALRLCVQHSLPFSVPAVPSWPRFCARAPGALEARVDQGRCRSSGSS
jgi:hypothetical protein